MKELLEGIALIHCIRVVKLSNNGINDEFEKEVTGLLDITKVRCIDLSNNKMNKLGGIIGRKIRDGCTHIQWIDLTQNDFYHDNNANLTIIAGLKK